MKQTAVEWLAENIDNLIPFMNDNIAKKFSELIEQSKEMEKQQQGYNELEVLDILREFYKVSSKKDLPLTNTIPLWFEKFKKK
jgi:hypothetical protein